MGAVSDVLPLLLIGLVVLVITVGGFLLLRAFWLWYWRFGDMANTLHQIRDEVRAINARQRQLLSDAADVGDVRESVPMNGASAPVAATPADAPRPNRTLYDR